MNDAGLSKEVLTTRELSRALISSSYQHIPDAKQAEKPKRIATGYAAWDSCAVVIVCVKTNTRPLPKRVSINAVSLHAVYDNAVLIDGALVMPYATPMSPEDYANWRLLER